LAKSNLYNYLISRNPHFSKQGCYWIILICNRSLTEKEYRVARTCELSLQHCGPYSLHSLLTDSLSLFLPLSWNCQETLAAQIRKAIQNKFYRRFFWLWNGQNGLLSAEIWSSRACTIVGATLSRNSRRSWPRGSSRQNDGEMSLRRKSMPRGMIFRWIGGFPKRLRHEFGSCSYPLLQSSRCDRNIIDSRELSRSVFRQGVEEVWRCFVHNNPDPYFASSCAHFRTIPRIQRRTSADTPLLFPRTCWSSLNRRSSLREAATALYSISQERRENGRSKVNESIAGSLIAKGTPLVYARFTAEVNFTSSRDTWLWLSHAKFPRLPLQFMTRLHHFIHRCQVNVTNARVEWHGAPLLKDHDAEITRREVEQQ
jgi:hypothetical protein